MYRKRYKIVRDFDGHHFLSSTNICPLVYHRGEWTKALRNTGILVYDTLIDAVTNGYRLLSEDRYRMFECEVRYPVKLPPYRMDCTDADLSEVADFWRNQPKRGNFWPNGTIAFKKVRLVKELSWEEIEKLLTKKYSLDDYDWPKEMALVNKLLFLRMRKGL